MQVRDNFLEIRSSYSETNHIYSVVLIPQRIIRKYNQFSDYIAEFTQTKITPKATGRTVKKTKICPFFQWELGKICSLLYSLVK